MAKVTKRPLPTKVPVSKAAKAAANKKKLAGKKKVAKKPAAKKKVEKKPADKKKVTRGSKLEEKNGVKHPSTGTITGQVWDIADKFLEKTDGECPKRTEVMAACVAEGINLATINTQFQRWRAFHGFKK